MRIMLRKTAICCLAAALLSGCMATTDQLVKDANAAVSKLTKKPSKADEYASFTGAEVALVRKLATHQQAAGLSSQIAERRVHLRTGNTVRTVNIAASFRIELPADALVARHQAVLDAVTELAEYCVLRSAQEPTRLVLVAKDQSEIDWMRAAAAETLNRFGSTLQINIEYSQKWAAIGWASEGAVDRVM